MPVFHRVHGTVLVVTVDGDFTVPEVERVGRAGLESLQLGDPPRVLLDLSGTAGSGPERLAAIAEIFAAADTGVVKLAVQGAANAGAAVVETAVSSGLQAASFTTRAEALDWLGGR